MLRKVNVIWNSSSGLVSSLLGHGNRPDYRKPKAKKSLQRHVRSFSDFYQNWNEDPRLAVDGLSDRMGVPPVPLSVEETLHHVLEHSDAYASLIDGWDISQTPNEIAQRYLEIPRHQPRSPASSWQWRRAEMPPAVIQQPPYPS